MELYRFLLNAVIAQKKGKFMLLTQTILRLYQSFGSAHLVIYISINSKPYLTEVFKLKCKWFDYKFPELTLVLQY